MVADDSAGLDAPIPGTPAGTNLPEVSVGELAQALKRTVETAFGTVRVRGGGRVVALRLAEAAALRVRATMGGRTVGTLLFGRRITGVAMEDWGTAAPVLSPTLRGSAPTIRRASMARPNSAGRST